MAPWTRAVGRMSNPSCSTSGNRPAWMSDVLPAPDCAYRSRARDDSRRENTSSAASARPKNRHWSSRVNGRGPTKGSRDAGTFTVRLPSLTKLGHELLGGTPEHPDLHVSEVLVEVRLSRRLPARQLHGHMGPLL